MTPLNLQTAALGDVDREIKSTRRVLERLPDEHFDWKPHEKSWTMGELAHHIANILTWGTTTLQTEELDLKQEFPSRELPANRDGVLAIFDQNAAEFQEELAKASEDHLAASWDLKVGEHVVSQEPRTAAIRQWALSHLIHHRGQFTVYLRLCDVPVPPTFGPTADERM